MKTTILPYINHYNKKMILAGSLMLTALPTFASQTNVEPSQQSPIEIEKKPCLSAWDLTIMSLKMGFLGLLICWRHITTHKVTTLMQETTVASRRSVLSQFIAYALSKSEVRFVNHKQLIDWMVTPEPLTLCADKQWQPHDTYQKGDTVDKTYVAKWWTSHQIPDLYPSSPWQALPHCIKQK